MRGASYEDKMRIQSRIRRILRDLRVSSISQRTRSDSRSGMCWAMATFLALAVLAYALRVSALVRRRVQSVPA